ncbi:hypothetical protein BJ170DRAFT_595627 [Xylariales sp. AK1849]|nr:hypothetical protein BJ170DRAFT_595627 [Xylariales sp. AK1849]
MCHHDKQKYELCTTYLHCSNVHHVGTKGMAARLAAVGLPGYGTGHRSRRHLSSSFVFRMRLSVRGPMGWTRHTELGDLWIPTGRGLWGNRQGGRRGRLQPNHPSRRRLHGMCIIYNVLCSSKPFYTIEFATERLRLRMRTPCANVWVKASTRSITLRGRNSPDMLMIAPRDITNIAQEKYSTYKNNEWPTPEMTGRTPLPRGNAR